MPNAQVLMYAVNFHIFSEVAYSYSGLNPPPLFDQLTYHPQQIPDSLYKYTGKNTVSGHCSYAKVKCLDPVQEKKTPVTGGEWGGGLVSQLE